MGAPTKNTTGAPRGWRGIVKAFGTPSAATMFFFGFSCGLPFLLVSYVLSIWLKEAGVDLGVIGLVSYASLFYTLKFFWAPLLDRYSMPVFGRIGRRRGWLLPAQLALVFGLLAMAVLGPSAGLAAFVAVTAVAAFAGATQDIVVDAYRIEIAPVDAQAALAATYILGYRVGIIAGGAGCLYLAELQGWRVAYTVMAALLVFPIVATVLAREPDQPPRPAGEAPALDLVQSFVGPFLDFFRRNGVALALALLAFVGLFKLPDQMLGTMAGPFYIASGFSKADIASVSKLYGVWIGIGGAFVGGAIVAAVGLRWSLVVAAVGVAVSNLLFVVMAANPGEMWAFMLTISGDNLAQGVAGTVLVAFMSSLASKAYTGTQYALLSSFASLPGKLVGGVSGFMIEASSYSTFFVFSTVSLFPTLLVLAWLWPRLSPDAATRAQ